MPVLKQYECKKCGEVWQRYFASKPWFGDYSIKCKTKKCGKVLWPFSEWVVTGERMNYGEGS